MTTTATPDLITTIERDGGFTYDPTTGELVVVGRASGYAIAVPGTEHVVGGATATRETFAEAVAHILLTYADEITDGAVLGGWYSEDREQYLVELSEIWDVDRADAILLGTARRQEGILDLATGEYIPTGGRGDA